MSSPVVVFFWAVLFLLSVADNVMSLNDQPQVLLNNTRIVGLLSEAGEYQVSAYLGIPYAVPPTGQLRFKKTVPLPSLPPVLDASAHKSPCFSLYPDDQQSEDCLYLNVWVPVNASSPLPVVLWIHGGGFITGSSASPEGGLLAAENDVIVVSFNYRLGPFGFVSTGDASSPGNYGLWDQHTALQWISRNIAAFGGDPSSVTLMGLSAGGKSVSFQVVSPYSGHLFRRAIMQSGTVYCPTSLQWKPVETATRLARAVACPVSSHDALVDCLRTKSAMELASAASTLWNEDPVRKLIDFGWAPVEDGDFVPFMHAGDGTLLPLTPTFTGSVMVGNNNNEGALLKTWRIPEAAKLDPDIEAKLQDPEFIEKIFLTGVLEQMFKVLPENTTSFASAAEVISYMYRDWHSEVPVVEKPDLYSAFGDQAYIAPSFQFLSQWLYNTSAAKQQAYVYIFDNFPDVPADEGLGGMKHADDAAYTFGTVERKLRGLGVSEDVIAKEAKLGKNFRKLLTNFVKSGNPAQPEQLTGWPEWPEYDQKHQSYLSVSSAPRVATRYRAKNITLWTHLVPTLVTRPSGSGSMTQTGHAHTCSATNMSGSSIWSWSWLERLSLILGLVFILVL